MSAKEEVKRILNPDMLKTEQGSTDSAGNAVPSVKA